MGRRCGEYCSGERPEVARARVRGALVVSEVSFESLRPVLRGGVGWGWVVGVGRAQEALDVWRHPLGDETHCRGDLLLLVLPLYSTMPRMRPGPVLWQGDENYIHIYALAELSQRASFPVHTYAHICRTGTLPMFCTAETKTVCCTTKAHTPVGIHCD